ncbi:MAG: phosphoesterase [Chloroflexus sp.]|uniref:DHH family phosphoesterase n=1 Tax=Chloroflexus sp. TaxID=1904827 RepID=UPI0021DD9B51|nr:bifunctional oligoribonuclease/PAP phosphatase NrnA [Chloroflexus sp.]GIV89936.1 MAG: phosphoesterase [Chloroflexus sp.]
MIFTNSQQAAEPIRAVLANVQRILLLSHVNPDGDAIGSLLGTMHVLRALGKETVALASSAPIDYCAALPGFAEVHVYRPGDPLPDCDLIWMVDVAHLSRAGAIYDEHAATLQSRPLVIVDHHATNDGGGTVSLIQANAPSCAEVLFDLFTVLKWPLSPDAATCLFLGMMTDTQSFQTPTVTPETLRRAAALLEAGADKELVVNAVFFSIPPATLRLTGMAMANLQQEDGIFWTVVTQEMLRVTQADEAATDDTVSRLQRVAGMRACVLFRERPDGTVKISLRSIPGIDVAAVAQQWGGGGHRQAAGATLKMSLAEAVDAVLPALRKAVLR